VHMIVPGGGIALDGSRWISSSEDYLLPVPVLSRRGCQKECVSRFL